MMRIILLLLALSGHFLHEANAETYRFSERWPDLPSVGLEKGLSFDYSGELQLENLLNEPVVGLRAKWKLHENSVVNVPTGRNGTEWQMSPVRLVELGPEALGKVALTDLKIEFKFSHPDRRKPFYLFADVGIMAKADGHTWSFNTNGSPSWDKVFYNEEFSPNVQPLFLTEPEAKKLWRSRPNLESVRIARLRFSEFDLHHWYWKKSNLGRTAALAEATRVLAANLERGYGFKELSPRAIEAKLLQLHNRAVDAATQVPRIAEWQQISASYESLFDALAKLPPEVTKHPDPSFYKRSVAEAVQVLKRESSRVYESPDPDVSGRVPAEPTVGFASSEGPFPDGKNKHLYKDEAGRTVLTLPSDWDIYRSYPFYEGVALIETDDGIFYIDETGARLTQGLFGKDIIFGTIFREGLAGLRLAEAEDQMHIVGRDGNTAFTVNTTLMGGFWSGLAWIQGEETWYINTLGERVLGPYPIPENGWSYLPFHFDFSADGYLIAEGNVIDTSGRKIRDAGPQAAILHGRFLRNREGDVTRIMDIETGQLVLSSPDWPYAVTHSREKAFQIEQRTIVEKVEPRCGKAGSETYDVDITVYDLSGREIDRRRERRTGTLSGVLCLTITK